MVAVAGGVGGMWCLLIVFSVQASSCFRVRHTVNSFCRNRRDGGGCFLGVLCGGVRVENGVNRELGAQIPRPFV